MFSIGVLPFVITVGSLLVWSPPHPFVGHTFQVPTQKTWRYFESLWHRYGPIFRLSLAGDEIVVLSRGKDGEALLGNRSKNYSSRKPLIYAGKYQSNTRRVVLLPYGEKLRKHRASIQHMLQPRAEGGYEQIVDLESHKLLRSILSRPDDTQRNVFRYGASLMFSLVYGKQITEENESDLDGLVAILENFLREAYPGSHLVDTFPILDLLPDFLSPWRIQALKNHDNEIKLYSKLVLEVQERMEKGDTTESCISRIWEQQKTSPNKLDLEEICYLGGAVTEAGTDTTAGSIMWLLMGLVLYPETLKKAQEEIDGFFKGSNVIPNHAHMKHLPYCSAIVKEAFRWNPAAPGGFPHLSEVDDEYNGYMIKGGTMVIPCTWNMHHNEEEFPDAYAFKPERWLEGDAENIHERIAEGHYLFGFGRRKCPGIALAVSTVWMAAVRLMWAFDIGPEYDEAGNPLPISPDNCTNGMTSSPLKFPMRVRPRSEERVALIMRD
ncbi:cytochrome P450 [Cyathus striatus]|nr:cytochrome P450 [Cyathus striatus]